MRGSVERNHEPARLRLRSAAAILLIGAFAESAIAQHKEDPIGPAELVHTEKREVAQPATPVRVRHKEDPIGPAEPARAEKQEMAQPAGPSEGREVYFYATSYDAQLEVHYETGWRVLCIHPCATRAFIGAEYRIAGDTIVTSRTFTIYPNPGPFIVRASAASASARNVGIPLTVVGGLALLVGGGWAGGAIVGCFGCTEGERNEAATPGAIVAASGAVLLLIGVIQLATTRTALSFGPAAPYGAR